MKTAASIIELIGRTPLVRLNRISDETGAEVLGKLESFNPGGSVKDRIGLAMIEAAEREGRIAPGKTTIIEPTSGNTGIALAMVAAARGYDLIVTMPDSISAERRALLAAFGARLVLTPGSAGMAGAVDKALELAAETAATPTCRSSSRTRPIPRSTGSPPRSRSGTTPTAGSTRSSRASARAARSPASARRFASADPTSALVAVEPSESAVLSGGAPGAHRIQGIGAGFVPAVLDTALYDEVLQVSGDDAIDDGSRAGARGGAAGRHLGRRQRRGRPARWRAGRARRAASS